MEGRETGREGSGSWNDSGVPLQVPWSPTLHSWALVTCLPGSRPLRAAGRNRLGWPEPRSLCGPQPSWEGSGTLSQPDTRLLLSCMYKRAPRAEDGHTSLGRPQRHLPLPAGCRACKVGGRLAKHGFAGLSRDCPRPAGCHWTPSSSTYVEGNQPIRPLVSPFHQPWSPPMRL